MRFFAVLFALASLVTPVVLARPSRIYDRKSVSHDVSVTGPKALRQYHIPRALLDVCLYIDADVITASGVLGIPLNLLTDLNICLCLSALPLELKSNIKLKILADLLGATEVSALLTSIINNAPSSKYCEYPDNSQPICTAGDPCGFSCNPPYTRSGSQCVCPLPNISCNGKCGSFPQGCSSAVPRSFKARAQGDKTEVTWADATAKCGSKNVCGVHNGGSQSFECIDVQTDVESCGGCMIPASFSPSHNVTSAVDCTTIVDVNEAACVAGSCVVKTCKNGKGVNSERNACVKVGVFDEVKVAVTKK